jgi:glycosyltransferase involved in cell wall biosynthesis
MHRQKIALLSPYYPPHLGGVSDYTYQLAQHLKGQAIVLTNDVLEREPAEHVLEVSIPLAKKKLHAKVNSHHISDLIIQYTPLAFNPNCYGINLSLISSLLYLKMKKANVTTYLYAHEVRYPCELTLKGFILGPLHFIQFIILCFLNEHVFFSTKKFEKEWASYLPFFKRKMSTVPIMSNIIPASDFEPIYPRKNQIIYFGGHHPTQYNEMAIKTMEEISKIDPTTSFVILGLGKDLLKLSDHLRTQTKVCGYLSQQEVSTYYQESKLALLPLMDGCSTRRGTLMCALAHGVPVMTNLGSSSDTIINWDKFCLLKELDSFGQDTAFDEVQLQEKGKQAFSYYRDHFSVEATSKQLLAQINT